jgi:hypothetical protein
VRLGHRRRLGDDPADVHLRRAVRGPALAALLALAGGAGCAAHTAGKNAAAGFKEAVKESQATTPPEQQIARVASTRAVEGAIDALDQPAERARFQKIVDAAVANAVASALRVALAPGAVAGLEPAEGGEGPGGRGAAALLAGQIGRAATEDALGRVAMQLGGEGALRQNIVATGASATDAAVSAALGELFPECRGDDAAACRRERVQALTRATAASFSAGVRDSLAWPLLFLAIAVGLTLGALAHWALSLRRRRPHAFRPV